jgi:hypothetical protein
MESSCTLGCFRGNQFMNFYKAKKVKLSEFENETWLQTQIEQDSTVLGLGDLVVLRRERTSII